ncbi:MAG: hypothetical protein Q8M16_19210 [Pirellulaceae bacterium]|nr:hypothetical protein [Pirellulaceae bacterium]
MTTLAKFVRATFPAVMIVVCSSVYFIFLDVDRTIEDPKNTSLPAKPDVTIEPTTMAAQESAPEKLAPDRIATATKGESIVRVEPVALQMPQIDLPELELPQLDMGLEPDMIAPSASISTSPIAEPATTGPKLPAPAASDSVALAGLPAERSEPLDQRAAVANAHFSSTPVNDYWVGLERGRNSASSAPAGNPGVITNPYHRTVSNLEKVRADAAVPPASESNSPIVSLPPTIVEPEPVPARPLQNTPAMTDAGGVAGQRQFAAPVSVMTTQDVTLPVPMRESREVSPAHHVKLPPVSDHVRQQVAQHWEYGGSLARRNAIQLARQEFFSGLSLLSDHADQYEPAMRRTQALREAFLALEEVRDFQANSELRQSNLAIIVQKHETPLIRDGHFTTDSHSQARQAYLLYAKERIRSAVGHEPMAAELLYSLGKLHLATFEHTRSTDNLDMNRATTLFECALVADPAHVKTCNELAVIQAKNNNWSLAKNLLQHAVTRQPQFLEAWQNLAKVHQRLGEPELARLATAQVAYLSQNNLEERTIRMVSNSEFTTTAAAMDGNTELGTLPPGGAVPNEAPGKFRAVPPSNR